jgi:hypothetical protein
MAANVMASMARKSHIPNFPVVAAPNGSFTVSV